MGPLPGFLHAAAPLGGLAVNVAAQLLLIRLVPRLGLLRSLFAGFGAGLLGLAAAEVWLLAVHAVPPADRVALAVADLLGYGALGYCYFHFVNLGVTARRPRLLIELSEAPGGLTYRQILDRYDAAYQVDARLQRLGASGQIVEREGRYFIGRPSMLLITHAITLLKIVLIGKRSEFD